MSLRYALIVTTPNELQTFDELGALLTQISVGGWSYAGCDITMDSEGNIYTETNWNVLKKYDSSGNLLVTRNRESPNTAFNSIHVGLDGYLYTFEGRASGYAITKRSTSDLTIIVDIATPSGDYAGGICQDSNGNFYIYNTTDDKIEKWNSGGSKVAALYVGTISECAGFGICGDNLYIGDSSSKIYYMPLDLSGYTEWSLGSSICYAITATSSYLVLSGWDGDGDGATSKYDSDRNLVWTEKLTAAGYAYKAGCYDVTAIVYDYPLAPIVFSTQPKGTPLRMKCKHFEEGISDVCLNVNHNVDITREYLQLTYGDTTYPESSNLRYILPSQQLVKLSSKDVDYNAIINNFITNISSMFTLINENNKLVKTWLDDYMPDEEGHDFTDVKTLPTTVNKDMDEEKLSKVMDNLFEAIEDNVIILNDNLELLKERF